MCKAGFIIVAITYINLETALGCGFGEGVGEDEQEQFEGKALGRDGVNGLEEALGELANGGFHAFAKMLNQKVLLRFVGPLAVGFAVGGQVDPLGFAPLVFQGLIGVGRIGIQDAAFGQLRPQRL